MNVTQGMIPAVMPAQAHDEKQYNAVAITVHKPTVETSANTPISPYVYPQAPIYNYPQTSVYDAPSAPVQPEAAPAMAAVPAEPAAQEVTQPQPYTVPESVIPETKQEEIPASIPAAPEQQVENTAAEQPKEVIAKA